MQQSSLAAGWNFLVSRKLRSSPSENRLLCPPPTLDDGDRFFSLINHERRLSSGFSPRSSGPNLAHPFCHLLARRRNHFRYLLFFFLRRRAMCKRRKLFPISSSSSSSIPCPPQLRVSRKMVGWEGRRKRNLIRSMFITQTLPLSLTLATNACQRG